MYIILSVRPEILFPVGYFGRFQRNTSEELARSKKSITYILAIYEWIQPNFNSKILATLRNDMIYILHNFMIGGLHKQDTLT